LHDVVGFTQPLHAEGTCQLVLLIGQHTLASFSVLKTEIVQFGKKRSKFGTGQKQTPIFPYPWGKESSEDAQLRA